MLQRAGQCIWPFSVAYAAAGCGYRGLCDCRCSPCGLPLTPCKKDLTVHYAARCTLLSGLCSLSNCRKRAVYCQQQGLQLHGVALHT